MRKAKQSTAKNVMILMVDSTDHVTGKTGLTLTITASKDGGAFASISPTVTERGNGWYNIALTSGHTDTLGDLALHITGTAADPADMVLLVEAGATDADVSTRLSTAGYTAPDNASIAAILIDTAEIGAAGAGLTALASAAALATVDTVVDSILVDTAEIGVAGAGLTVLATQASVNTIDDFLDTEIAAIKAKTDNLPTDPADQSAVEAAITAATAPLATAVALATVDSVVDAILLDTAEIGAAGAGLTALATQASVNTIDDFLDTEIAAIKAQTDLIPAAPAAVGDIPTADITAILADTNDIQTRLPAALVGGRMDSNLSAIGNDTTALTAFKRAVLGNIIGTVGAASTTTSIVTSSMTPAAAVTDQFLGRIVVFDKDTTTANLRGQATDITASTDGGVLTVTALTTAPASGDTFTIL